MQNLLVRMSTLLATFDFSWNFLGSILGVFMKMNLNNTKQNLVKSAIKKYFAVPFQSY